MIQNNIKERILDVIKDMSMKIERDSKHIYRNPETGDMYQGVSTVSSIIPKDWLAQWGAKEAVKFLGYSDYEDYELANQVWQSIKDCKDVKAYIKILHEAKGASSRKSKKAMVDGTKGHAWLETYVLARINDSMPIPTIPTDTLQRPIEQFLEWESKEVDYWIASEALVVRPDKFYAGQLDAIYMSKKGELTLCDFKFASHISEEYYLQTGGYAATFEPYGISFDKRAIIRLPKTLEQEEWNPNTFKYTKVPNNIEFKVIPTRYEADRDAFFHALPVKGWINYVLKIKS